MNYTCDACPMEKQCEIKPTFKEDHCPCTICLVKGICCDTCKPWELYYKKIMYNTYKVLYNHEPSGALDGHLHNKYERQRMMRLIKNVVTENACATFK